jgi:hypothetical protein
MMPHRDNSGKSSFPTANKSIVRVYTSASDYTRENGEIPRAVGGTVASDEFVDLLYGVGLVKAQEFFRTRQHRDRTRPMRQPS